MSAQTERILRTPARTGRWVMVALAAAIAVGAAVVLPRVLSGSSHLQGTDGGRSTVTTPREYANQGVTGTGPGLVQVAEQSQLAQIYGSATVSGTGPDLAVVGAETSISRTYSGQVVTGTGPDLARVGGASESPEDAITGTGPDLARIAHGQE
jgi:hypothetical protein